MPQPLGKNWKPTRKHAKMVKHIADGDSASKAGRMVGFSSNYGAHLMKDERMQSLLLSELERVGVTDGYLAEKTREGLNAMAPPRKDGGIQYPDYFVRKQYLDIALRVRGDYAPERTEHTQKVINITLTPDFVKGLIDAKAITYDEAEILEGEVIDESFEEVAVGNN